MSISEASSVPFYTLIKLCYTKALSDQAWSLVPKLNRLLLRSQIQCYSSKTISPLLHSLERSNLKMESSVKQTFERSNLCWSPSQLLNQYRQTDTQTHTFSLSLPGLLPQLQYPITLPVLNSTQVGTTQVIGWQQLYYLKSPYLCLCSLLLLSQSGRDATHLLFRGTLRIFSWSQATNNILFRKELMHLQTGAISSDSLCFSLSRMPWSRLQGC